MKRVMSITLAHYPDYVQAAAVFPGAMEPFLLRVKVGPGGRERWDAWQRAYDLMCEQILARGLTVPSLVFTVDRTNEPEEEKHG